MRKISPSQPPSGLARRLLQAALAVLLLGCGEEDALRQDARRFGALHAAIAYEAAPEVRQKAVDALASAPFSSEEVRTAQQQCVDGHRALLREEARQEENAGAIDKALEQGDEGAPLPHATIESLKEKLSASERGLTAARDQLRDCESRAQSLELRFGRR